MSTDKKRPQLSLDELHQTKWLLGGVLALLSIWTVFYLDLEAWGVLLVATAGIAFGLVRPDLAARTPAWAGPVVFGLVVSALAYDLYTATELLPPLVRLTIWLLLYRCVSPRARRDDLQLVMLGLFLVVVAGVLTVSPAFAGQILLFTACALAFLFVVTLVGTLESPSPGPKPAGVPPGWTRLEWRRLARRLRETADWRLIGFAAALFAGVVAVSAVLFLAIPRFQLENSFFLDKLIKRPTRSGFTDSIHFGDVVDIIQDNAVAMRVEVSDPAKLPAMPYWRMVVLDEYEDGTLKMSRSLRNELERRSETRLALVGMRRAQTGLPVYWTFYLEPGISRYLPLTGPFEFLRFREPQQVQVSERLQLVALRTEPPAMAAYRVEGMETSGLIPDQMAAARLTPEALAVVHSSRDRREGGTPAAYPWTTLETAAGEADRRTLAAAVAEITGGGQLPAPQFAQRACEWLWRRHSYALSVPLPAVKRDRTVAWLDSNLPGHCELFAVAFTLLSRTAGHPTRVVSGFKGGEWNAFENYLMVKNANAHAWCEVFDGHGGWFRVDPTIGAGGVGAGTEAAGAAVGRRKGDRSLGAWIDSLRIVWYRRIVSFDQRTQSAMVQKLRETTRSSGNTLRLALEHAGAAVRAWLTSPWDMKRASRVLAAALAAAARAWAWRRFGMGWRARIGRRKDNLDPVRREAGRWLRKLRMAEDGLPNALPQPPALPSSKKPPDEEGEVVQNLERLRYGPRQSWPEPQLVFRQARRTAKVVRGR